ncbi:MAG: hypothetical protein WD872_21010 [Pirellulaceae bacterium]
MTREFSDELLSAYLDGQLSAAERATVDAELAANPDLRQLLDELQSLTLQVQSLPRLSAPADFSQRVVQAAVLAAAEKEATVEPARPQDSSASPHQIRRRVLLPVVLAGTAAVAASVAMLFWRPGQAENVLGPNVVNSAPEEPTAAERALAQLRQAIPQEGAAVVLRLRVGPGQTVSQALAAAGITERPPTDLSTEAMQIGAAYRSQLAEKFGGVTPGVPNLALDEGTIAATDALFVEAAWESLEQAVASLAESPEHALELSPLMHVAISSIQGADDAEGEGEAATTAAKKAAAANYAQRLNAGMFRLEKAVTPVAASTSSSATTIPGTQRVKVLLLIEHVAK